MIGYRKPREPKRLQESTDHAGLRILAADHRIRSAVRADPSAVCLAAGASFGGCDRRWQVAA
jgi:hypothetical protein